MTVGARAGPGVDADGAHAPARGMWLTREGAHAPARGMWVTRELTSG